MTTQISMKTDSKAPLPGSYVTIDQTKGVAIVDILLGTFELKDFQVSDYIKLF